MESNHYNEQAQQGMNIEEMDSNAMNQMMQ